MPMLVVCLPTYNERDNLEAMVRALAQVFDSTGVDGRILVIDDSSPDGTGELADRLATELSFVSVLHRPRKEGLGPAYVAGFRRALAGGADLVVEMDCDFSHNPEDVPRLVAIIENGADVALGSRYVPGGATRNWGRTRRVVSRAGCVYARTLLGVPVQDLTGGFKCFRRSVLDRIDLDLGFRVVEVPIVFTERQLGHSKMSRSIVLEAATHVPALRLRALAGRL
jgi:dolichol-phosphate mannosyltransferase